MSKHPAPRVAVALAMLAATGCTSLREVPRAQYQSLDQPKHVRVDTVDGLTYEFDYAKVASDTLTGYRERDTEGPIPEVATVSFSFDDIAHLSVRSLDWYRTGLIGGGVLAGLVAAGLSQGSDSQPTGGSSGGGGRIPE